MEFSEEIGVYWEQAYDREPMERDSFGGQKSKWLIKPYKKKNINIKYHNICYLIVMTIVLRLFMH